MNQNRPQIEVIPTHHTGIPTMQRHKPWFRAHRFLIFSVVFLLCASTSLVYVFSRPAVYQSNTVLLTVAATGIDQHSSEADIEHVAIQRQILSSQALLQETLLRMQDSSIVELGREIKLSVADIRQMLMVKTVTDTNLVDLVAEGYEPALLPFILNTLVDVYFTKRAEEIRQSTRRTTGELDDELFALERKINLKSQELDNFRRTYQIASIEREENEALARLKGLNESLNKSSEEEVKAAAKLNAIKTAIARGQVVIPQADAGTLASLQKNAESLRSKLDELDQRFTREYLALQPTLKELPAQLSELEQEINILREHGQKIVLSDADREYMAAKQTVQIIRQQLDAHKTQVAEFTTRFAQHEKLKTDLEGLGEVFRETQQRLVKIQAKQVQKYPQLSIVDRAYVPRNPVRPNYFLDAVIAVSGSLVLGLLSVWLFGFLNKKETDENSAITLSGIHVYEQNKVSSIANQQTQQTSIAQQTAQTLAAPESHELPFDDLQKLFALSNNKAQQLIALLLNGLSLEEILRLHADDFDFEQQSVFVSGDSQRVVPASTRVVELFQNSKPCPSWQTSQAVTGEDLEAILMCAVVDSGISHPDQVTAECLRHSYIIYLVRQGLKLSELELLVGYLTPAKLASYRVFSPPSRGCSVKDIDLLHPALQYE